MSDSPDSEILNTFNESSDELEVSSLDDATVAERVAEILGYLMQANTTEALDLSQALMRDDPRRAEAYYLIGLASAQFGDVGRAATLIRHAHDQDPDCRDYADVLGVLYTRIGNLTEGLYFAKLATALDPHPFIKNLTPSGMDAYFNALQEVEPNRFLVDAMIAFNTRNFERASQYCGMALRIDNENIQTHILVGRSLMEMFEPDRAAAAFHTAIHIDPANMQARVLLADCLDGMNRRSEADAVRTAALYLDPTDVSPAQAAMRALPFRANVTVEDLTAAEDEVSKRLGMDPIVADPDLLGGAPMRTNNKKRIGYIGARFFEGPDATFFRDVIINHNRNEVEIYVYQESVTQSDLITQLKARTDGWREIYDLDSDVVASIISGDGIDALIDLGGYTEGMPMAAMAIKPATIQVGWFNHVDGAGDRSINLVLSDPMTNDIDEAASRDGQTIAVIETGMLSMQPPEMFGPISDLPALAAGCITFGATADLKYLNAEVARVWSEILMALPNARLVLRAMVSDTDTVTDQVIDLFAHFGMVGRIHFYRSETESRIDPEFFDGIDIHLDPFPVSRPEDVALALWAGVPSVTMKGPTRLGRLGASVLNAAGQSDWITETADSYVAVTADLARATDKLAETRAGLRRILKESNFFNPVRNVRSIEGCVMQMLEMQDGSAGN